LHIALFGKFPPIQGGVSTDVFEFVEAAANAGHRVHVFTNASEAEIGIRTILTHEDHERLRCFEGLVTIYGTTSLGRRLYVPYANPYLSKLIGAGLRRFSEIDFDLVIGWYFEPYALAAAIVAQHFALPLFLKTAGSDIGKLSHHFELSEAYAFVARSAFAVLGGRPMSPSNQRLLELGARQEKIISLRTCALPQYYRKHAVPIELDWRAQIEAEPAGDAPAKHLRKQYVRFNDANRFHEELVTIGVFGKIGEAKGTYDLIDALVRVSQSGYRFNVLWMPAGTSTALGHFFAELEKLRDVHPNVVVLPPIAPWKIPGFLARCDIACVLERKFPVEFHGPRLPREILASGTALLLSKEIADKQPFRMNLIDKKNCAIVADPTNRISLADGIRFLIDENELREYIGKHGQFLSQTVESFLDADNSVLNAVSDLFEEKNEEANARVFQSSS
jgi:glycosyltransferase involved in cell wall biosynthesis